MVISELLEQARQVMRLRRLSLHTEKAYLHSIRGFIRFHGRRHPRQMGAAEIRDYLSHLAIEGQVAASTQNVALNALVFLYRNVLQVELAPIEGVAPARRPARIPVVYSRQEVRSLLASLEGTSHLMASLLYGAGLRLMECVRLRVKDLDFDYAQITIRDGKGQKDRRAPLPRTLVEPLQAQLDATRVLFEADRSARLPPVYMPQALARKYPRAGATWPWQWISPSPPLAYRLIHAPA